MSRHQSDVLIIGAGVIGLSCAWYLLKAGRSVTIIDQGVVGGGASKSNCGTITPSHATPLASPGVLFKAAKWMLSKDAPFYVKPRMDLSLMSWLLQFARRCNAQHRDRITPIKGEFLNHSRQLIDQLITEQQLECEYASNGTFYVYRDEKEFAATDATVKALHAVGIPAEQLDDAKTRAMEPCLKEGLAGSLYFPTDGNLRPDRFVSELARIVCAAGGSIEQNAPALSFEFSENSVAVKTPHGDFQARDVILAAGAWSPILGKKLGIHLPIQPGKGYSITYDSPQLVPTRPMVLREPSVCVAAWGSGYRLGSTMEFSGYDTSLNRARLDALERGARGYLHDPIGPRVSEEWFGWRPMTWDDLPILGRSPKHKSLWLAVGHGMLGMSMSAVTGTLMTQMMEGKETLMDVKAFSPLRFY